MGFDPVQFGDPGSLIAEDGVRIVMAAGVDADQLRPVWDEDEDFRVQSLELGIIMPQLRHMVGAVNSGKAEVEDEENAARGQEVGEFEEGPLMVGEGEVGGRVADG